MSLDFILAVVAALIVLGSIAIVSDATIEMQKRSTIKQQLQSIGTGLAATITASGVLNDADNAIITYTVPKISVPGEKNQQGCDIIISGNELQLSYELFNSKTGISEIIEATVPVISPSKMTIAPKLSDTEPGKCGNIITIMMS